MKSFKYCFFIFFIASACNENDKEAALKYESFIEPRLECMNMSRPEGSYNYPIYPGTGEWENLSTGQEMLEACQIPTSVLGKMSTQAVTQAIWEHPLLFDVFHRYQYQMDFESTFLNNNAYKELTGRVDAGKALFDRLNAVKPLTRTDKVIISSVLELLISQSVFLSQLDNDEKKKIVEITLKNDNLRQHETLLTDSPERAITWLLIGRVMINADYSPFIEAMDDNNQLKSFIDDRNYSYMKEVYGDIPEIIIEHANNYVNNIKKNRI